MKAEHLIFLEHAYGYEVQMDMGAIWVAGALVVWLGAVGRRDWKSFRASHT